MKHAVLGVWLASVSALWAAPPPPLPAQVQRALNAISANELKGDLSFLASDALQGRYTPSPGLDVAAEFIASKFRAAGLEPGGNQDYFQTAEMVDRRLPGMTSNLTLYWGENRIEVPAANMTFDSGTQAANLVHASVVILPSNDPALLNGLDLKGKVVMFIEKDWNGLRDNERAQALAQMRAFNRSLASAGALLNLAVLEHKLRFNRPARLLPAAEAAVARTPSVSVLSEELLKLIRQPPQAPVALSLDIPAPLDTHFVVKNVIGVLRGSDPVLSKTAVLLTAHYDHIGTVETAAGLTMGAPKSDSDRVYNGANDDGSGTVSVIEIARALANLKPRPKRSIVFMTFFGEERGELGSQFYGKHPIFPIGQTVADLNLEQMGRTDATNGPQLNNASVTGFDYSEVTDFLVRAGQRVGIKVYRDAEASDAYFARSDNAALAEQGVPAHTMCVAFDYPDYHGLGDEWPKVNYENMAKVDRMVALALLNIANSPKAPEWNAKNSKTEPYRAARAASQSKP